MAAWKGFLYFALGQEWYAAPLLQSVMEERNSSFDSLACDALGLDIAQLCARGTAGRLHTLWIEGVQAAVKEIGLVLHVPYSS